jgi:hypothetical protein
LKGNGYFCFFKHLNLQQSGRQDNLAQQEKQEKNVPIFFQKGEDYN